MAFTDQQIENLQKPLDPSNVKPPAPGKYGDYIEGWKVIEIANEIFGHDGWDCNITRLEMTNCDVFELNGNNGPYKQARVGYLCTVQVTAGGVTRSGTGHGTGAGKPEAIGDHHDSAAKEAETDAMKRALRTFGYPLGLALYDKTKAHISDPNKLAKEAGERLKASMDRITDIAAANIEAFSNAHDADWALMGGPQRDFLKKRMEKHRGNLAQKPHEGDVNGALMDQRSAQDLTEIPF